MGMVCGLVLVWHVSPRMRDHVVSVVVVGGTVDGFVEVVVDGTVRLGCPIASFGAHM